MNLRQIEVFRAVMLGGSVTAGAAMLHVSAPAVSRLLSHLESRLGVPLFERRGGRLIPKPEARTLMREIDGVWQGIARVRQSAAGLRHGGGAGLRVSSNLSTALELVPRATAKLRQRLPEVHVTVEVATLAVMRDGLAAGDVDLGVGAFVDADLGSLTRHRIRDGELRCVLPPNHALARRHNVPWSALRGEDVIAYGRRGPHGQRIERLIGRDAAEPAVEVPYAYMACAMVACGQGVAVVDDLTLRHFPVGVVVKNLVPAVQCSIEALSEPHRPLSAAATAFVQALEVECA